jgi:hypothetical protein
MPRVCRHDPVALMLAAVLAAPVLAQQAAGPVAQPSDLLFGTLHQGATVQADFEVTWPGEAKAEDVKITPPTSVRLLRATTSGTQTKVWITVATTVVGACQGDITVSWREHKVAVPVQAVVLPSVPGASRVLVADSPWEADSSTDSSAFAAWRRVVDSGKLEVSYLLAPASGPVFSVEQLQRTTVVLVGTYSLLALQPEDLQLLHGFVCGGGRVVVAANAFFVGTVGRANALLTPFGLRMQDQEPEFGKWFEAAAGDIAAHPLTAKVESVRVTRPSPTLLVDAGAQALVKLPVFRDAAFIAVAGTASGGEIIALGQSLWWNWLDASPHNERLLRNLLTRPSR